MLRRSPDAIMTVSDLALVSISQQYSPTNARSIFGRSTISSGDIFKMLIAGMFPHLRHVVSRDTCDHLSTDRDKPVLNGPNMPSFSLRNVGTRPSTCHAGFQSLDRIGSLQSEVKLSSCADGAHVQEHTLLVDGPVFFLTVLRKLSKSRQIDRDTNTCEQY